MNGGCKNLAISCDDNNVCTTDSCDKQAGCGHVDIDCDDGNKCTSDICDPDVECIFTQLADGTACGDPGYQCKEGECKALVTCDSTLCPKLSGYTLSCSPQGHCEYSNEDSSGWKKHDVWIWVPKGTSQMGSPNIEPGHESDESPVHTVTIPNGFLIGKYEVTVAQYEACQAASPGKCTAPSTVDWPGALGTNSSANGRSEHPQNGLTWQQAKDFCSWAAPKGRLPSEAEWEYAAAGPVHLKTPWGDSPAPTCSNDTAVMDDGTGYGCGQGGTWKVGSKTAGAAWSGALDMSGNVWEWCEDWYHNSYVGAPVDGSAWVDPTGSSRVHRGGSFSHEAKFMRSSERGSNLPGLRYAIFGARCVRPLDLCEAANYDAEFVFSTQADGSERSVASCKLKPSAQVPPKADWKWSDACAAGSEIVDITDLTSDKKAEFVHDLSKAVKEQLGITTATGSYLGYLLGTTFTTAQNKIPACNCGDAWHDAVTGSDPVEHRLVSLGFMASQSCPEIWNNEFLGPIYSSNMTTVIWPGYTAHDVKVEAGVPWYNNACWQCKTDMEIHKADSVPWGTKDECGNTVYTKVDRVLCSSQPSM